MAGCTARTSSMPFLPFFIEKFTQAPKFDAAEIDAWRGGKAIVIAGRPIDGMG
jgi:hypothetical protein